MRWLALMLLGGKPDATLGLLSRGAAVGHIVATLDDVEIDPDGVRDYVTLESQILLHQTIETLLRLFLAHQGQPPCPWLEVAGELSFGAFKDRVKAEIIDGRDLRYDIDDLLLGGQACATTAGDAQHEQLQGGLNVLTTLLKAFATRWLEEAHSYNSLKHGLSVSPGAAQMSFTAEHPTATGGTVLGSGPSLDYLECSKWVDSRRTWSRTAIWIDPTETMAIIELARQMITSLWAVARHRYIGSEFPRRLVCPAGLDLKSLRTPGRAPGTRATFPTFIDELKH